jgi:predicted XRE-type DNA-binding protein
VRLYRLWYSTPSPIETEAGLLDRVREEGPQGISWTDPALRGLRPLPGSGGKNLPTAVLFADLGLPAPDELPAKARLASAIVDIIDERGLTQSEAGELLKTTQPKVSNLVNGRLEGFSLERLARFPDTLDRDVEIVVRPRPRSRKTARILVSVGSS